MFISMLQMFAKMFLTRKLRLAHPQYAALRTASDFTRDSWNKKRGMARMLTWQSSSIKVKHMIAFQVNILYCIGTQRSLLDLGLHAPTNSAADVHNGSMQNHVPYRLENSACSRLVDLGKVRDDVDPRVHKYKITISQFSPPLHAPSPTHLLLLFISTIHATFSTRT